VPWVDSPASPALLSSLLPKPRSQKRPVADAPACAVSHLSVTTVRAAPMSQDDGFFLRLRTPGRTACLLPGRPRVVASEPGLPTVVAGEEGMPNFAEVANTGPHGLLLVRVDIPVVCQSDQGGNDNGLPVYHSVAISYATVGRKTFTGFQLRFPCGMAATPFYTPKPSPTDAPDPLDALLPRLQLPTTVRAGGLLTYQVELTNPGNRSVALSPCPVYIEHSSIPTKLEYRLNCSTVDAIPAHGSVHYEIKMAIPASAPTGRTELFWSLFGPSTKTASAEVLVE
jgi:hypothetical protein